MCYHLATKVITLIAIDRILRLGLETLSNSNTLSNSVQDLAMPKQRDHRSRKPNDPAATGKLNPHPPRQRDPKDVLVRQNNPGFPIHKKEMKRSVYGRKAHQMDCHL